MKRKRRHFGSKFKTKVVLEALKERETIQQIASKYELHPNQITNWKKQFLENADKALRDDKSAAELKKAILTKQTTTILYKINRDALLRNDNTTILLIS